MLTPLISERRIILLKKIVLTLALVFALFPVFGLVVHDSASANGTVIDSDLKDGKMYDPNGDVAKKANVDKVNKPLKLIVQIFGGVGGTCFVLAVMYYAVMIIFGSLNPQKAATYWKALLGCAAGAFVFFGAATFADVIAGLSNSAK